MWLHLSIYFAIDMKLGRWINFQEPRPKIRVYNDIKTEKFEKWLVLIIL